MVNNNYPYYTAPYYQPQRYLATEQAQPQLIKGRPVTSIEEVRATTIDFDGSVFVFPDFANKHIYTKQINPDGTSTINVYELIPQITNNSKDDYITRNEFDSLVQRLQQRFAGMEPQNTSQQATTVKEAATSNTIKQVDQSSKAARPQFNF